jgi:hypothetical protein
MLAYKREGFVDLIAIVLPPSLRFNFIGGPDDMQCACKCTWGLRQADPGGGRTGISYSRWSTEATTMEEFRQYPHYMQPRIHKMMQEVRALPADRRPSPLLLPAAPLTGVPCLDAQSRDAL